MICSNVVRRISSCLKAELTNCKCSIGHQSELLCRRRCIKLCAQVFIYPPSNRNRPLLPPIRPRLIIASAPPRFVGTQIAVRSNETMPLSSTRQFAMGEIAPHRNAVVIPSVRTIPAFVGNLLKINAMKGHVRWTNINI